MPRYAPIHAVPSQRPLTSGGGVINGVRATAAMTIGALSAGALAVGVLAVAHMAIGRLTLGRARIRRLEIDELVVRRLRVVDIWETPEELPEHEHTPVRPVMEGWP